MYDKPMIYYPLQTLVDAGLDDILIVSGRGHAGHFLELLGSGSEWGVRITYEIQDEAGGIAQALGLAKGFADEEEVVVILGDNIFQDSIGEDVHSFIEGGGNGGEIQGRERISISFSDTDLHRLLKNRI